MTLANAGIGAAAIGSFILWVAFIGSYIAYGNRFRSAAGRALMVMSFGYAMVLIPQILRHPFGIMTDKSLWFTWFQISAITMSAVGTLAILALMIRANGHWPWRRPETGARPELTLRPLRGA
jgi:hypothetical protein